VLRILSVLTLLTVVAAGCGGDTQTRRSADRGVPRTLAQGWEAQASAIADAAAGGDDCRALQLASSLRDQVVAAQRKVPLRLRSPLLTGVNALADRITCTPPRPKKEPKPPPGHHDDHKPVHHGHGGGNGNDQ
jgi:hypothetical protein